MGKPSSYALAQEVADHAVTLVKDDNHMVPMQRGDAEQTLKKARETLPRRITVS